VSPGIARGRFVMFRKGAVYLDLGRFDPDHHADYRSTLNMEKL
jgi:hypothetical protein